MKDLDKISQLFKADYSDKELADCYIDVFSGPVKCYIKFGMTPNDISFTHEELKFRVVCLQEEYDEMQSAYTQNDSAEFIDAIVDLSFFAIGTVYRMNDMESCIESMRKTYPTTSLADDELLEKLKEKLDIITNAQFSDQLTPLFKDLIATCIDYLVTTHDAQKITEYYNRVTAANLSKEVGSNAKRGSFSVDLVKPEGWSPPNFIGLECLL